MSAQLDRLDAAIIARENRRAEFHAAADAWHVGDMDDEDYFALRDAFFAAGDEVTVAFDAYQQTIAAGLTDGDDT